MKKLMTVWIPVVLLLASATVIPASAQEQAPKSQKQTAKSPGTDARQKNILEYIQLLRSNVRQQKAEIMGAMMQLSAEDAAKFWPIYSEYDAALTKVDDMEAANIQEYARTYSQMTDDKADELARKSMEIQNQRNQLLVEYYGRVKDALGATTAARFLQIEHQLLLIIDLQIASSLPLVGQGS